MQDTIKTALKQAGQWLAEAKTFTPDDHRS